MVGLSLAMRVAEAAGTSFAKASRFVSDVGPEAARTTVSAVENNRNILAGTGLLGVGGISWNEYREQEVAKAKAAAEAAKAEASASDQLMRLVEEDDISPELRATLMAEIAENLKDPEEDDESDRPKDPNDSDGNGGFLADLLGLGDGEGSIAGQATTVVILLVVVVFVLNYGLAQASTTAVRPGGVA